MKEQFRIEKELHGETPNSGHKARFIDMLSAVENANGSTSETKSSKVRWMPWLSGLAAAAVGLWAVFTLVLANPVEHKADTAPKKFNPIAAMSQRSLELEGIFTQHIQPQIPILLEQEPSLKSQVELLDRLDKEYVKLKTMFVQTQGNESVTRELIRNHKLRLQIMEQMLHQLELMKSIKSKKNEIKSA